MTCATCRHCKHSQHSEAMHCLWCLLHDRRADTSCADWGKAVGSDDDR